MKQKYFWIAAALAVALSACGGQDAGESKPPATPVPTTAATAAQTPKPTAAPAVTVEPTAAPTQEPTASPTPEPTPRPTPAAKPSETPAIHVIETLPPEESVTPEPTESLCALPLAPAPEIVETPEPPASESPAASPGETPSAVPTAEPGPTPEPTIGPEITSTPEPSPAPAATLEPSARPSDEEVLAAYHQAREAYTWFDLTTLPLDFTQPKTVGELTYYPVADERFPTMDALRAYLKTLFSDEIVDTLLPIEGGRYVEIDGVLCASDDGPFRGTDENSGAVTEMVVWPQEGGDSLCSVQVTVALLWEDPAYPEGVRKYEFPYQKVGDKWVFTHFEAIM